MAERFRSLLFRWPGMLFAAVAGLACLGAATHALISMTHAGAEAAAPARDAVRDYRRHVARDTRAAELGIEAVLELDGGQVRARVFFEPELLPGTLDLELLREDGSSEPLALHLEQRGPESYSAPLPALADGTWLATLNAPEWRLKARLDIPRFAMVHITPGPSPDAR